MYVYILLHKVLVLLVAFGTSWPGHVRTYVRTYVRIRAYIHTVPFSWHTKQSPTARCCIALSSMDSVAHYASAYIKQAGTHIVCLLNVVTGLQPKLYSRSYIRMYTRSRTVNAQRVTLDTVLQPARSYSTHFDPSLPLMVSTKEQSRGSLWSCSPNTTTSTLTFSFLSRLASRSSWSRAKDERGNKCTHTVGGWYVRT